MSYQNSSYSRSGGRGGAWTWLVIIGGAVALLWLVNPRASVSLGR